MAPPRKVPDKNTLQRWTSEGMTHQAMADRIFEETGEPVTRAAVTLAMMQYGLSQPRPRYKETLPWRVSMDHIKSYPARMLRLLGRRRQGLEMSEKESQTLDAWLEGLAVDKVIVAYDPEDAMGFHYIDQRHRDHKDKTLPIRKKTIHVKA